MNLRVDWGLPKLAGQPILQQHDVNMLEKSLGTLRKAGGRHEPSTSAAGTQAGAAGTQAGDARMQPELGSPAIKKKRKRQKAEGESEAAAGRSQASW